MQNTKLYPHPLGSLLRLTWCYFKKSNVFPIFCLFFFFLPFPMFYKIFLSSFPAFSFSTSLTFVMILISFLNVTFLLSGIVQINFKKQKNMIFKYKVTRIKKSKKGSLVKAVEDENNRWKINLVYSIILL